MGITKRSFSPIPTRDVEKSSCEESDCDSACLLPGQTDIRNYLTSQPVKPVHADLAKDLDADEEAARSMGLSFTIDDDSDSVPHSIFDDLLMLQEAEMEAAQALLEDEEQAAMAMGYSFGIDELDADANDYDVGMAASESCLVDCWEYVGALNKSADLCAADEDSARIMGWSFGIGSDAEGDVRMEPESCVRPVSAGSLVPSPSTPTGGSLDTVDPGAPSTPKRPAPDDIVKHTPVGRPKRPRTEKYDDVAILDKMSISEARTADHVANSN
eukprot:TRINITY_DN57893_c0_g1_i1.p1 TRINITY_DN57893_c0_g1~~TRINITY_DN57893_c0_g1_i1.p1  ORF type:complete len:271 (+),score=49.41 TRINITY_DN57893_c0_g1_i1:133-945(+)